MPICTNFRIANTSCISNWKLQFSFPVSKCLHTLLTVREKLNLVWNHKSYNEGYHQFRMDPHNRKSQDWWGTYSRRNKLWNFFSFFGWNMPGAFSVWKFLNIIIVIFYHFNDRWGKWNHHWPEMHTAPLQHNDALHMIMYLQADWKGFIMELHSLIH